MAQSANDNMKEAIRLNVGKPVNSHTEKNTVEAACINEELTGKCIKYHNDQWYIFNTDSASHLYINISDQKCRDLLGVQLVVFEGDLCQPHTYSMLSCVSLATQDDIFVELENLKPHHDYWINIDGYLHDFCAFALEVNAKPNGVSAEKVEVLNDFEAQANGNKVLLEWSIPDSLLQQCKGTKIQRREQSAFKFGELEEVPMNYNAFGNAQQDYFYTDSLFRPGTYYYRLILELQGERNYLVKEVYFHISDGPDKITLPLDFDKGSEIQITIIGGEPSETLSEYHFGYSPADDREHVLFTDQFLAKGIRYVEIKVVDLDHDYHQTYYADLEKGIVKRY
ncbi:hypothetical protein [Fulvivirga ligni]|uniref:hypothetical protein n=1 Tax=Fulvivirga ligni TaxID=2904246 RepID=UPI001F3C1C35|nr:hypothetical protein [Fulvivirga ligni]UII24099.1 hypothetical protein LVD16_12805 [Fulvivirga ligni]